MLVFGLSTACGINHPRDQSIQMPRQHIGTPVNTATMFHSDHKNMICYSTSRVCRLLLSIVLVVLMIAMFHPLIFLPRKFSFRPSLRSNSDPSSDSNNVMINGYAVEVDPNVATVIQHPDGSVSVVLNKQHEDERTLRSKVNAEPVAAAS
jgi:hypothetical protein